MKDAGRELIQHTMEWIAAIGAGIVLVAMMMLFCGCSARAQHTPVVQPPAVVEVIKPVPIPCPIPQWPQEPQLILPLIDPATTPIKSIMDAMRVDYAMLWMAYQQARDIIAQYVQQAEVKNAEEVANADH